MSTLFFIDMNGMIGMPVFDPSKGCYSSYADLQTTLKNMDYYGIDYALVTHYRSYFSTPMEGNTLLIKEIKGCQRLFPCWCLIPHHTGETDRGLQLEKQLRKNKVKAVRLVFGAFNLIFNKWCLKDLLELLEQNNMPVIFHFPTLGVPVPDKDDIYLDTLHKILIQHPNLKAISSGRLRGLYPLLEECKNLFVSMEWDSHPDFVEDICRRFGPKRLLFATPYCENARENSGMTMMMLLYASIGDEDKKNIAGKNLANLLGIQSEVLDPIPELRCKEGFRPLFDGKPLPYKIIDIHAHAGPWSWEYKPGNDLNRLIQLMDLLGVEKSCVSSSEAIVGGDHIRGNEELAVKLQKYPERLIGFAVINPQFDDCQYYIDHCIRNLGYRGLKIHPRTHHCAIIDNKYIPVWEASQKYHLPVLCHTGEGQAYSDPDQFRKIAPRYPEGIFILGHAGETFPGIMKCIEIAKSYNNIYLDISGWGFMKKGYLEFILQRVDAKKLLFGSDYSWIDIRYALGTVVFSSITEEQKRMILYENSNQLLSLGRK
jgi:hypothetical protein